MPFGAVSALCLMAIGSTANAAACISLGSPNAGGIPAEGCSIGGTESNFTNLTDSASDAAILWSGTTHTVPDNINDDEDHVAAALDHIFNQFVDVERLVRLDSGLSGGDLTITPTNGSPMLGGFTTFNWEYSGLETLSLLTMKAGTAVIILDIEGLTSGSGANTLIFNNPGTEALKISHVSIWTGPLPDGPPGGPNPTDADEPAAIALAAAGLLGVAWMRRRRSAK